jgi:hypothetical protein
MDGISDMIRWFHENSSDAQPNELLYAEDRIAGFGYFFAEELHKKKVELAKRCATTNKRGLLLKKPKIRRS